MKDGEIVKKIMTFIMSMIIVLVSGTAAFADNYFILTYSSLGGMYPNMVQDDNYRVTKEERYIGDSIEPTEVAEYTYNIYGDIEQIVVLKNNEIENSVNFKYVYDRSGRIENVKKYYFDVIGEETEYYYKNGILFRECTFIYYNTGERVKDVERYFNEDGNCTKMIDYYGKGEEFECTEYLYRNNGNLVEEREMSSVGYDAYFHYDGTGKKIELWNEGMGSDVVALHDGVVVKEFNEDGLISKIISRWEIDDAVDGNYEYVIYYYYYDSLGRIIEFCSEQEGGYQDGHIMKDIFIYNEDGSFYRIRGKSIREVSNSFGRIIIYEDQYGNISEANYDEHSNPITLPDQFEYDEHGNVKTVKVGWTSETYGRIDISYELSTYGEETFM